MLFFKKKFELSFVVLLCFTPFLFNCGQVLKLPASSEHPSNKQVGSQKTSTTKPPKKVKTPSFWAKRGGTSAGELVSQIKMAPNGNVILLGSFHGIASFGSIVLEVKVRMGAFVAALDSSGNWLWAKRVGPESIVSSCRLAVEPSGDIVLTGLFKDKVRFGTVLLQGGKYQSLFVAKMSKSGDWLWAAKGMTFEHMKHMGASLENQGLALHPNGNISVVGQYRGRAQFGKTALTAKVRDTFISVLDSKGNWLRAEKFENFFPSDLAITPSGSMVLMGRFEGSLRLGSHRLYAKGRLDLFVAKRNQAGNWVWATRAGSTGTDGGRNLLLLQNGDILISGFSEHSADFGSLTSKGLFLADTFVAKLSSGGKWLMVKHTGNPAYGMTVDKKNNIFLTGRQLRGDDKMYIKKLDPTGKALWSQTAGATYRDVGVDVAVDNNGGVYTIGQFAKSATFGNTLLESKGSGDFFIWKLNSNKP